MAAMLLDAFFFAILHRAMPSTMRARGGMATLAVAMRTSPENMPHGKRGHGTGPIEAPDGGSQHLLVPVRRHVVDLLLQHRGGHLHHQLQSPLFQDLWRKWIRTLDGIAGLLRRHAGRHQRAFQRGGPHVLGRVSTASAACRPSA